MIVETKDASTFWRAYDSPQFDCCMKSVVLMLSGAKARGIMSAFNLIMKSSTADHRNDRPSSVPLAPLHQGKRSLEGGKIETRPERGDAAKCLTWPAGFAEIDDCA